MTLGMLLVLEIDISKIHQAMLAINARRKRIERSGGLANKSGKYPSLFSGVDEVRYRVFEGTRPHSSSSSSSACRIFTSHNPAFCFIISQ
jgi:hypothetical protein